MKDKQLEDKVKEYFEKKAESFDAIYKSQKNLFRKMIDTCFRQSMKRRFQLTLSECGLLQGKTVLDIGCGSGRYSVELTLRGAKEVTGIDFSSHMLGLAEKYARERGAERCFFIQGNFLNYNFNKTFDICLAIGLFDYTPQPLIYLKKIKFLGQEKIIMSFPAKWKLRTIVRKIRLGLSNCPVYFYTPVDIKKMMERAHFENYKITNLGRDYLVVAYVS